MYLRLKGKALALAIIAQSSGSQTFMSRWAL